MIALLVYKVLCYLRLWDYLKYLLGRPRGALPRGASSRLLHVSPPSKGFSKGLRRKTLGALWAPTYKGKLYGDLH